MKGWKCKNCGHEHEATASLEELGFQWLTVEPAACKTSCMNCGSYTIQQVYTYDENNIPIAGQFLMVTTKNKIKKRGNS
jgi:uncharacterized Zn finger protein